jgi:hypothetical protein
VSPRSLLVDHVLIVTHDPDSTVGELYERTGLRAQPGGEHVGLGTRNQIVPLGEGFLEIVEVYDKALARDNAFGRLGLAGLADATARGAQESLFAWSTAVPDVAPVAERTGTECVALTRAGVSALLCSVDQATNDPSRPFFLQRGPTDAHPGERPAAHAVQPIGFTRLDATRSQQDPEVWLHDVPSGSVTVNLLDDHRRGLTRVEIGIRGADPVVLTAGHPTGIA